VAMLGGEVPASATPFLLCMMAETLGRPPTSSLAWVKESYFVGFNSFGF